MAAWLLNLGFAAGETFGCGADDTYTLVIEEDTGPGAPPKWVTPEAPGLEDVRDVTTYFDTTTMFDIDTASDEGRARLLRVGFAGASAPATQRLDGSWDQSTQQPITWFGQLNLWDTPPQSPPTFGTLRYVYPDGEPRLGRAGQRWKIEDKEVDDPAGLLKGNYTVAYQLFDSRTGRKSALSEIKEFTFDRLGSNAAVENVTEGAVWQNLNVNGVEYGGHWINKHSWVTFPALDLVYDSDKWDTVRIYRSLRYDPDGIAALADVQLLNLEAEVTLAEYATTSQPTEEGWARSCYFLVRTDKEIIIQPKWIGEYGYNAEPPYAGAGLFHQGTMFYGNIEEDEAETGTLGVVWWSDTREISPELVPPFNLFTLMEPTDQVLRFLQVGPSIVGLTDNNMYLFRKDAGFVRGYTLHANYGVVGPRAAEVVGSTAYIVTRQGLKQLTSQGALSDFVSADGYIRDKWKDNLDNIELAYDGTAGCLMMHNPDLEETVAFWMENQRQTSFHDSVFTHATSGPVMLPDESVLQNRACFVYGHNISTSAEIDWPVMVVDYERAKNETGRFMDFDGTARADISLITNTAWHVDAVTPPGEGCVGGYLYITEATLDGAAVDTTGLKMKIEAVAGSVLSVAQADVDAVETAIGGVVEDLENVRVAVSPVFFRWTGSTPRAISQDGFTFGGTDFHRVEQIDSLKAAFVDVSGDALTDTSNTDNVYWGQVFSGNAEVPVSRVKPLNRAGVDDPSIDNNVADYVAALGEGQHGVSGVSLFPSIEVVTPDLDFTLLQVTLDGAIRHEQRTGFTPRGQG